MTGDLRREHWVVPVHGLATPDPDGTAQAIARPDGTVILRLTCGGSQTTGRLDVSGAAQLATGIWEAAGIAQRLTGGEAAGEALPGAPATVEDLPPGWREHSERQQPSVPSPRVSHRSRPRRLTPAEGDVRADAARAIGLHIRRVREARDKSLRVLSGLAGMSTATLHRIEHGRREPTLSEIAALAHALQVAPWQLIQVLNLIPHKGHKDSERKR